MLDFETIISLVTTAPDDPRVRDAFADPSVDEETIARVITHLPAESLPLIAAVLPSERMPEILSQLDYVDAARIVIELDHDTANNYLLVKGSGRG
ncbi:MAG: hypothetical protein M9950_00920 [Thermomicrobiales bacterium]|nr:hypothetical protein [Thermomicrobiales bacterium]